MENSRITTTILLVLVSLPTGIAEIVTKPTVTEVVVGRSTFLNCSTNSRLKIDWFRTPLGSIDTIRIPIGGRFQLESNEAKGEYNLVIPSVKIEDAGIYGCQEETGQGIRESAQLIVLDADPVCEPHLETHEIIGPNKCGIEPNQVILFCTVKYLGNEVPRMAWRRVSDGKSVSEGVTHGIMDNNRVVYNLSIKGNSSVMDGDSYVCNTTRSAMSNYGCKSGKIKVTGTDFSTCAASESCNVNSYIAAIIFLVVLLTAIFGTVFVLWYLRVYRPRKPKQKALNEVGTREEMDNLHRSASSLESHGQGAEEETSELNPTANDECNNDADIKIKTLENQLKESRERIYRRDKAINDHKQNDESNKSKINNFQLEKDQLQDKVRHLQDKVKDLEDTVKDLEDKGKDLEQRLYAKENIDYLDEPVLAHMIQLSEKNKGKAINGITVLGTELFIVTKLSQEIEVYDSQTFQHQRNMEIRKMTDPLDIASSKVANCLYIVDQLSEGTESKVMMLDTRGKILFQWPSGGRKGRLSTYGSNVVLCLSDKQLINEYSPDGELIVTVRLSPAAKLINPQHAIKVTSARIVVSHGDFNDELHRVCVVDLDGVIKNECTKWEKSKDTSRVTMRVPICLVEDNERSIIVADLDNKRILLLSSILKYQRKLIEEKNDLRDFPVRLCFDDTQSRLFVAVNKYNSSQKEWKGGRILIYNVK